MNGSSTGYFGGLFSSFWRSREEMMDDEISFLSTDESVVSWAAAVPTSRVSVTFP